MEIVINKENPANRNDIYKLLTEKIFLSHSQFMSAEDIKSLEANKINLQVSEILDEAIDFMLRNKILMKTYPELNVSLDDNYIDMGESECFELTNKAKLHIQSQEPTKFFNNEGVLLYILDFLP